MVSINFYPSIGGIEVMTENLAREFTLMGHKVTIITNTLDADSRSFPFNVLRCPKKKKLFDEYRRCDVYVHQSVSLKYIWPLLLIRKTFFIVYHQVGWERGFKGIIKSIISHFSHNICVSKTTAKGYHLKKYDVIYNAYNDNIFKLGNDKRRKDILFVGRLNKDKGAYLLIEAFNDFKQNNSNECQLNMIGDSSERNQIENFARNTKYYSDIHFLGLKSSGEIANILNRHHILAVTSTHPYYEAFGIVVLEGLACGCIVIGADGDGIEEALHSAGILYKNGDKDELYNALIKAYYMTDEEYSEKRKIAENWLRKRTLSQVALRYIEVFERSLNIGYR